jgi:hypothetical protein
MELPCEKDAITKFIRKHNFVAATLSSALTFTRAYVQTPAPGYNANIPRANHDARHGGNASRHAKQKVYSHEKPSASELVN